LVLPVARVAVDNPLPHLDRSFDYLVEESQSDDCVAGCRVRVRFAGKLVGGFVLERVEASEHGGRLAFLERVVSPEVVLTGEIAQLVRAVADRWAGSFADVVRLAVPPRHASVEKTGPATTQPPAVMAPTGSRVGDYVGGDELLTKVGVDAPRAVIEVLPGDWPALLAELAAACLAGGRGVVVVVPDHRDVARMSTALTDALGADQHVSLTAELGPAERYRRFLRLSRGHVRCVVGTRAAVWAPVHRLGLVVVWDDGDDLHAEPRAPYCHARDVAALRAHRAEAGVIVAGHAVTAESALLVESGWAQAVVPTDAARATVLPAVRAAGDDDDLDRDPAARAARLPTLAWRTARDALDAGLPVLVQVPRRGYQLSLQCAACRAPARCDICAGPLYRGGAAATPACRWCGAVAASWRCRSCGGESFRAGVVGAARTAEELGRAFPGVVVRSSGGEHVLGEVPAGPALVVATPGAEPVAPDGYGAALLLDGWALLGRPDLRAAEEALRRWLNAAALVRPRRGGGRVVVVAAGELRPVQALLRWRPGWHAARELEDRETLHLPPAARLAGLTGPPDAVRDLLTLAELPAGAEVLGPVPAPVRPGEEAAERLLVRAPRRTGGQLAATLHAAAAVRSARKAPGAVRIELDPVVIA
jgi:primosomal protein N' (replication factor Y)